MRTWLGPCVLTCKAGRSSAMPCDSSGRDCSSKFRLNERCHSRCKVLCIVRSRLGKSERLGMGSYPKCMWCGICIVPCNEPSVRLALVLLRRGSFCAVIRACLSWRRKQH